jgi:hypothetical protein
MGQHRDQKKQKRAKHGQAGDTAQKHLGTDRQTVKETPGVWRSSLLAGPPTPRTTP